MPSSRAAGAAGERPGGPAGQARRRAARLAAAHPAGHAARATQPPASASTARRWPRWPRARSTPRSCGAQRRLRERAPPRQPLEGHARGGEGLNGQVAVAVRRGQDELAARIDKALAELQPQIQELARKYGFPLGKPTPLSARRAQPDTKSAQLARACRCSPWLVTTRRNAGGLRGGRQRRPQPVQQRLLALPRHRRRQPGVERDLRKLQRRYKDNWRETALTTIKNGRPDAGNASWRATYNDQQIDRGPGFPRDHANSDAWMVRWQSSLDLD